MDTGDVSRAEIDAFLEYLTHRGRGTYTLRTYRLGLEDFSQWLAMVGALLAQVTVRHVEAYIARFASGDGRGMPPPAGRGTARAVVPSVRRAPRTVNHRLSVLSSFFEYLIERDTLAGEGQWAGRVNPVPARGGGEWHGIGGGGDAAPRRPRAELRMREPRDLPTTLDDDVVRRLLAGAGSCRDRALLLLLSRTGQRIGDWSEEHGRHGILGLRLSDVDQRSGSVTVLLKGARDEHRVPVLGDFWVAWQQYLESERGDVATDAAWVCFSRGSGKPLNYQAFNAALTYLGRKVGVRVRAHMFRHTVASKVVETAGPVVAQQLLGHRHVSTTVDTYAHVDAAALVKAVARVDQQATQASDDTTSTRGRQPRWAFHYDSFTIAELGALATPRVIHGEEDER